MTSRKPAPTPKRNLVRTVWHDYRGTLGYVLLAVVLIGLVLFQQQDRQELRTEITRAQAFDDRRDYEICLSGNEFRRDLRRAFDGYTAALVAAARANATTPAERRQIESDLVEFQRFVGFRLDPVSMQRDCRALYLDNQENVEP